MTAQLPRSRRCSSRISANVFRSPPVIVIPGETFADRLAEGRFRSINRFKQLKPDSQFDFLKNHGCQEAQGSYFSAVVDPESFTLLTSSGQKTHSSV
jgi:hypothetical protein